MKPYKMAILFLLLIINLTFAEPSLRTCEPIRVDMCTGLGYNETGMPNLVGYERQKDAVMILKTFQPLVGYGCSAQLKFFLCSVYLPMCTDKVQNPIGPCRGLCEKVRSRCFPILQGFGFPWPSALNCSRFPVENNHEHMCMEGPSEMANGLPIAMHFSPSSGLSPCSKLKKSNRYIYIHRTGRCVPYCNADILFDNADKNLAEVWLSIWAILCFVSTLFVILTFALDSSNRGRYPEKPLLFLALCYMFISIGWGVRIVAGRTAVACRSEDTVPGRFLLTEDGFGNANCAVVFLLLYYFGMAASVWWTILCFCWLCSAGLKWTQDRLQGLSSLLHLAAWGLPAAQTVAVLVRRDVDADELTGACYVGAQNPQTLLYLVLLPQVLYLVAGTALLCAGCFLMSRKGSQVNREDAASSTPLPVPSGSVRSHRKGADLVKLGVYGVLYLFPHAITVCTVAYTFFTRDTWLSTDGEDVNRPQVWLYLLEAASCLAVGLSSVCWVWDGRTLQRWRRLLPRAVTQGSGVPLKQPVPLPLVRYGNVGPVPGTVGHRGTHTMPLPGLAQQHRYKGHVRVPSSRANSAGYHRPSTEHVQ